MNKIQIALFLLEEAINLEPALEAELKILFSKDNATKEDFQALREKVASESYAKLIPNSQLPPAPIEPTKDPTRVTDQVKEPPAAPDSTLGSAAGDPVRPDLTLAAGNHVTDHAGPIFVE